MGELYAAVKNIIIFMLLVTVFSNLVGKSGFKQYMSIFIGLVLILIVVRPVLVWINADNKVDYFFSQNLFKANASDLSDQLYQAEGKMQAQIIEQYKDTLKQQIESQVERHDLTLKKIKIEIVEDSTQAN